MLKKVSSSKEEVKGEKIAKSIMFYRERDAYGYLSNFAKSPIDIDGKIWPTTEHYFQAMKFPDSIK